MGEPDQRRSCTRKRAYATEKQARVVALSVMRKQKHLQMHAYACSFCGQWHIGRVMKGRTLGEDTGT